MPYADPDKDAEWHRQWAKAHPEKVLEKSRRWRKAHPEHARELGREASRRWRARHPEQARERNKHSRKRRIARFKAIVNEAKTEGCNRCGSFENLEFHHLDPGQKSFTIGKSIDRRSEQSLRDELAKCIVLCRSCHRVEHPQKKHRPGEQR